MNVGKSKVMKSSRFINVRNRSETKWYLGSQVAVDRACERHVVHRMNEGGVYSVGSTEKCAEQWRIGYECEEKDK